DAAGALAVREADDRRARIAGHGLVRAARGDPGVGVRDRSGEPAVRKPHLTVAEDRAHWNEARRVLRSGVPHVVRRPNDLARDSARLELALRVLRVREVRAVVNRVPAVVLGLGVAD